MRYLVLLALVLSLAAYRGLKTDAPLPPTVAAAVSGNQTANILFQSADGGQTWQDLSKGLPKDLLVNCIFSGNGEVFLGTDNGLYHTRQPELGRWEQEEFGNLYRNDFGALVLNKRVTGIFAGRTGPYVSIAGAGFFRKVPGTDRWQPMHEALKEKNVQSVVEKPDGTLLVSGQSGIYTSSDDGKTWKHVFQEGGVSSLVADGDLIVGSGISGLLRSTDGIHWDCVLPDAGAVYNVQLVDGRFAAVRTYGRCTNGEEVISMRISSDHGQTWQQLDDGRTSKVFYDLEQAGDDLFCSHKDGISRSTDGGNNWKLVRPAEPVEKDKPMTVELAGSGKTILAIRAWAGC